MVRASRKRKRIILTPKKIGGNFTEKAKDLLSIFPKGRLSNQDLSVLATKHKIRHFRGVFMSDTLPLKPWKNEAAILNLDTSSGIGTHWVCYRKIGDRVTFFNSIGNRKPPISLSHYLKGSHITINRKRYQKPGTSCCGQLCLLFLLNQIA